jgi:hypothetical protein
MVVSGRIELRFTRGRESNFRTKAGSLVCIGKDSPMNIGIWEVEIWSVLLRFQRLNGFGPGLHF